MKGYTQICLVSKQAMPNIIPALMYKPEKVILLTTKEESRTAVNIKNVLKNNSIESYIFKNYVNAYNINSVTDACKSIIISEKSKLILNFTGGTKIMAIAAYEFFRNSQKPSLYCDTEENKIIHFQSGNITYSDINTKISVEDYLQSYGYKLSPYHTTDKKKRAEKNKQFVNFIDNNLDSFLEFIDYIKPRISNEQPKVRIGFGDYDLDPLKSGFELSYKNRTIFETDNINEITGTWFEDYCYFKVIKNKIDDILFGTDIISGDNTENEIDILLTKNCKLYIFSCKNKKETKNINKQDLYELEGLRLLAGGTFAKAFKLVTYIPLASIFKRANELKITLLTIKQLNEFII